MLPTKHDFTLDSYIEMVENLLSQGFQAVSYAQSDSRKKHLILRHDVDFDLEAAVEMATRESQHGLKSTYFILLRGEFYNVASDRSLRAVHKIADFGHDIGLHFDASLYETDKKTLSDEIVKEADVLAALTGLLITTMSLHRPHPSLLNEGLELGQLINSYAPKFFKDFGYCSDSNGGWHYDYPLEHPALSSGQGLHLLTHPIWWVGEGNTSLEKLDLFLEKQGQIIKDQLSENCKLFAESK